jgi:hypothetical protein
MARSKFSSQFLTFSSVNHYSAIIAYSCTTAPPQKCAIVLAFSHHRCLKLWAPCLTSACLLTGPGSSSIPLLLFQQECVWLNRKENKHINSFIHSFIHQWFYSPLLGPGLFFSFVIIFTQTVGLLGQ